MSFIGRIIGTVFFSRGTIKDVAESKDASGQAWILLFIGTILGAVFQTLAYQETGDPTYLGTFATVLDTVIQNGSSHLIATLVVLFIFQILLLLFVAGVLAFVGRGLGGKFSTMEVVRIIAFTSVLGLISNIILYLAAVQQTPSLILVSSILGLWQLILWIYAYSVGGDIGIIKSIIAIIIAVLIAGILLAFILIAVLTSLFLALSVI